MVRHATIAGPSPASPSGLRGLIDVLYPRPCPCCGAEDVGFPCPACDALLGLRAVVPAVSEVEEAWALAPYAGPVGAQVARAKREGDREALRAVGQLLARRAHDLVAGGWFTAVVPAPSPWPRRLRRGFAPGHVLAAAVAHAGRLPLWSVLSVRPGRRQSSLAPEARPHNLARRLRCRPLPPVRLLLVDDVITSGTTITRCAAMLRAHGASGVWALGLCDARRPLQLPDSPAGLPSGR